jgi:hypothetical protein
MSRTILITIFAFTFLGCNAQVKNKANNKKMDLSFVKNEKIKHSIVMMSCDTCVPITNIGYRVVVALSKKQLAEAKKISPEKWVQLLNDNNSDYLANLILYELYNKSAIRLLQIDNIEKWRRVMKKEDLEYWNTQFKK